LFFANQLISEIQCQGGKEPGGDGGGEGLAEVSVLALLLAMTMLRNRDGAVKQRVPIFDVNLSA